MKKSIKVFFKTFKYAKECQVYLWIALLFVVLSTIAELFIPIILGVCVDYIVGVGMVDFTALINTSLILVAVIVGCAIFTFFANYTTNLYMYKATQIIRKKLFDKINRVPISFIDSTTHGDLLSRMVNDIELLTDGFLEGISTVFNGVITIILTLVFMFSVNVTIALIITIITPLSLIVAYYIAKKSRILFAKQAKTEGEISGYLEELITGQRIVKAFNHEEESINSFEKINDKLYECGEKAEFIASITNPLTRFVNGVVYIAVGFTGALLALKGQFSIGKISTFLSYANSFGKPFNELSSEIAEIQSAFASAERIFTILDEKDEISDENLPELPTCDGSVLVENGYFSYNPKQKLLENINLDIKPGQKIAIVGPTGCGKTTFINLLMRFYDLTDGTIYVSGTDITQIKRNSLRNKFGMVLQDSWMFNTSIRDNISYGKPNATIEEIVEASKMAGAHEFIEKMANGYDTIISEGGNNISQGQKQLICIARIMLLKPPMLILDEATSNIDTRTEMKIQEAFDSMMVGRTSFIVAHRLSTIKNADLILVMNKGNIIEQGTHNELLAKQGFYYNLYNSQFSV